MDESRHEAISSRAQTDFGLADVQQAMFLMLQNTYEKHANVPNKELRERIMRKFEALPGEVVGSEPIIKLKKEILEEMDKRLWQSH